VITERWTVQRTKRNDKNGTQVSVDLHLVAPSVRAQIQTSTPQQTVKMVPSRSQIQILPLLWTVWLGVLQRCGLRLLPEGVVMWQPWGAWRSDRRSGLWLHVILIDIAVPRTDSYRLVARVILLTAIIEPALVDLHANSYMGNYIHKSLQPSIDYGHTLASSK